MSKTFYRAIFYLCIAALAGSCATVRSQNEVGKVLTTHATEVSVSRHASVREEVYASFIVQKTALRLVSREGRCTLLYAPQMSGDAEKSLDVGMAGPCNFVGTGKDAIPQHFVYGKGAERRAVFLITGGPPSAESPQARDKFMPNGCGTWLAKIYVYEGRVKIAWTSENGPPICPSGGGMEEVFFST